MARNTVVLAYQHLITEGYLVSKERSGYFVNPEILAKSGDQIDEDGRRFRVNMLIAFVVLLAGMFATMVVIGLDFSFMFKSLTVFIRRCTDGKFCPEVK